MALSIIGDKDAALDVTQEVFIKAFRAYKDVRFGASPETWLMKIAMNKVRDYLRGERLQSQKTFPKARSKRLQIGTNRPTKPSKKTNSHATLKAS